MRLRGIFHGLALQSSNSSICLLVNLAASHLSVGVLCYFRPLNIFVSNREHTPNFQKFTSYPIPLKILFPHSHSPPLFLSSLSSYHEPFARYLETPGCCRWTHWKTGKPVKGEKGEKERKKISRLGKEEQEAGLHLSPGRKIQFLITLTLLYPQQSPKQSKAKKKIGVEKKTEP